MTTTDMAAVGAANDAFYEAFEAMDLDRMRAVWDDDPESSCIHPGWREIRGPSHIMRSWAAIFANTAYLQFFLTDVDVTVSGDLAVVRCRENILTSVDRGEGGTVLSTNVYRRRSDGWRLWVHHGSPVLGEYAL